MVFKVGRVIDHLHLRVSDVERSKRFYRAVFESLDLGDAFYDDGDRFFADELYFDAAEDRVSHVHLAFQAKSRDHVDAFHVAALEAGGFDNGKPGLRDYHSQYYAAYVFDPDGNNIEAVCDAPTTRSAEYISIKRIGQS